MFINIPILNPLSNDLGIITIETNFTSTTVDNITLESVSDLSFEWWFIRCVL